MPMEKAKRYQRRTSPFKVTRISVTGSVLDETGKEIPLKQYLEESPKGTKILFQGKVIGVKS